MARSNELLNERSKVIEAARTLLMQSEEEKRDLTPEEQVTWARLMEERASFEERIKRAKWLEENPLEGDEERFVWDRQRDAEHPPKTEQEDYTQKARAYRAASLSYWLKGGYGITPEERSILHDPTVYIQDRESRLWMPHERRAQEVQNLASGGFWVWDEMAARIEKAMLFFGGMRQVSEIITTDTGGELPFPVYDDTANVGALLAESGTVTELQAAVAVRWMHAYTYTSRLILISLQLIQDSPLWTEGFIADILGERVGRIQNTHFTSYNAPNGPRGLIVNTTVGVTAAATGAVTADELEQMIASVPVAYRGPGCRWMMSDATFHAIMRLKDGEGRYLFMPDPRTRPEDVALWGYPVTINNDMPAMATTERAIVFGDLRRYKIRDVRGFTLLRQNELYSGNLQVGFHGFARADGEYINAGQNPIRHLAMA